MKAHLCSGKTCRTHPERVLRMKPQRTDPGVKLNQVEGMVSALSFRGLEVGS